ncbi:MAG: arylsulfatase A-like enzyme [Verrucomicrobiales bacterium]|jgi:arylsulfatase A-like enzyme
MFSKSLAILAFFVLSAAAGTAADQPNVVFVITDDQGWPDIAAHGNPIIKTPSLDQLHGEAVRLEDYHVAPTCSPTRAGLLTGHWTNRTGVWHTIMGRSMIRKNEVTLAQHLKDGGYVTGMFGKWHLGDNYPFRPEDRGFDEVLRHGGGGVGQTPDYWDNAYFDGSYFHNSKPEAVEGFCSDVFFDFAKKFITANKEGEKPFFAYISTNAPHGPMHAPERFSKLYPDLDTGMANYYGMISNIDENVGKMREFLREQGLEKNTIFVFTTDNGSVGTKVFNGGMKGGKGSEFDGGHRVPFFIYWPEGGLKAKVVNEICGHVDVVPTMLDLCGVENKAGVKFDGVSIRQLLEGKEKAWPARMLVTDSQRVRDPIKWRKSAVMSNDWRLINGEQLFQIKTDPMQAKNVAGEHPEIVKSMRDFYDAWWADLEPSFKIPAHIILGNSAENPSNLTCHDWITDGSTPWNQGHVRSGDDKPKDQGFWYVWVEEAGDYEIELRRWPAESDREISGDLPAGKPVPGTKAFRTTPGKAFEIIRASVEIGEAKAEAKVPAGAKSVTLKVTLTEGEHEFWAKFHREGGKEVGAYYAYVKKL